MKIDLWLIAGFGILGLACVLISAAKKAGTHYKPKHITLSDQGEFRAYKRKIDEDPNNPKNWMHWANALIASGRKTQNINLRIHRYNEACLCYAQATEIAPTYLPAWTNWGMILYELFRLQKSKDVLLLEGGHNKFKTALEISPSEVYLWQQWAKELHKLAATVGSDHKRGLMSLAHDCTAKAEALASAPQEQINELPSEEDSSSDTPEYTRIMEQFDLEPLQKEPDNNTQTVLATQE